MPDGWSLPGCPALATIRAMEVLDTVLTAFVADARAAFADDLLAVVLFGSAAEGRLRATSDVNVIVVLSSYAPAKAAALRSGLALARAAVRLRCMFVLREELPAVARHFAVKFSDIVRRHRVLFGADPFADLVVPRAAAKEALARTLLNSGLRLREQHIARGTNEEQLALLAADEAGALRACAAELLHLEGAPAASPREALQTIAGDALADLSRAREDGRLPPGVAGPLIERLLALVARMQARVQALPA